MPAYELRPGLPSLTSSSSITTHRNVPFIQDQTYRQAAIAALGCALCFLTGFVMIFWIEPGVNIDPTKRLEFILSNGRVFQLWYLIIFVLFGSCLLFLARGIQRWMEPNQSALYHLAVMFGFIWAAYVFSCGLINVFSIEYLLALPVKDQTSVWFAIYAIQIGLGDGVEWVGGIWLVTLSWHLLKFKQSLRPLHVFGLITGIVGCLTMLPGFGVAGLVFGLAQIVWFCWVGVTLYHLDDKSASD